jgi:hypothetical protein
MVPFRSAFITYKETPDSYAILADKSKVACSGLGTVQFSLQDKSIILHDVLHVPKLRSPLLSVRYFRSLNGCCFIADNSGSFLTFPHFILAVEDSSDCTITGHLSINRDIDFDSRLVGTSSTVSDNTRFRKSRPGVSNPTPSISNPQDSLPTVVRPSPPTPTLCNELPNISVETKSSFDPKSLPNMLEDLNLSTTDFKGNELSPKQIQEITTAVIRHLKKHGCVTTELINFIRDGYSSPKNTTSSTPVGRPTLLASDKMSNTAPCHTRFTIPQLSRCYGFRSLKNWDTLHDVCVPNFSFIQSMETPVELGNEANIKKAEVKKILLIVQRILWMLYTVTLALVTPSLLEMVLHIVWYLLIKQLVILGFIL